MLTVLYRTYTCTYRSYLQAVLQYQFHDTGIVNQTNMEGRRGVAIVSGG
jgi:hypothetical protein